MALITDKFGKASIDNDYAQATTVKTTRTPSETILAAFDLSKFPLDTPVFFVTYKKEVDPITNEVTIVNQTSWKALVNIDNNTLTNLELAPGYTDTGNEVGDYIEAIPTSFWANELVDGLSQSLNPDGTPKAAAIAESGIWWQELARTTLSSANQIITTNFTPTSYMKILLYISGVDATIDSLQIDFNGGGGSVYSRRLTVLGDTYQTSHRRGEGTFLLTTSWSEPFWPNRVIGTFDLVYIQTALTAQIDGRVSWSIGNSLTTKTHVDRLISGEFQKGWNEPITSVRVKTYGGNLNANTELVVLGHD